MKGFLRINTTIITILLAQFLFCSNTSAGYKAMFSIPEARVMIDVFKPYQLRLYGGRETSEGRKYSSLGAIDGKSGGCLIMQWAWNNPDPEKEKGHKCLFYLHDVPPEPMLNFKINLSQVNPKKDHDRTHRLTGRIHYKTKTQKGTLAQLKCRNLSREKIACSPEATEPYVTPATKHTTTTEASKGIVTINYKKWLKSMEKGIWIETPAKKSENRPFTMVIQRYGNNDTVLSFYNVSTDQIKFFIEFIDKKGDEKKVRLIKIISNANNQTDDYQNYSTDSAPTNINTKAPIHKKHSNGITISYSPLTFYTAAIISIKLGSYRLFL